MKSVIAFAALLASGPALAVTVPGAAVSTGATLYLNDQVGFSDYVGPLRLSVGSRTGRATGLSDYGRYKTTLRSRAFSLADGMPQLALRAFAESTSSDQVTISDPSGNDLFTAEIRVRVKTSATNRTTGFSGAEGLNLAGWSLNIFDLNFMEGAGIRGNAVLRDTPRTPVRTSYIVESYNGTDRTTIASSDIVPTGFQTYSFVTRLRNASTFAIDAGSSCFTNMTSFRINDTVNNNCAVELQLDGFTLFDPEGTPYASTATNLRSTSGYDYRLPYFPAPLAATRAFEAAAVPEPGAWLLMIAGFGVVGAVARQRRSATTAA